MAIAKQVEAKSLWDQFNPNDGNFDSENWVSKVWTLTEDPRLGPSDAPLTSTFRAERMNVARQLLFKLAFPKDKKSIPTQKTIAITTEVGDKKSEEWEKANDDPKLKKFKEDLSKAGQVRLRKEDQASLESRGYLPKDFQGSEITSALHLYSRGVSFEDLSKKAELDTGLTQKERDYLLRTSYIMATFEEANLKEDLPSYDVVKTANLSPTVNKFAYVDKPVYTETQFTLVSDGTRVVPVLPKIKKDQDSGITSAINGKLQDTAFKAIEKGGEKIAKKAAAKVAGKAVESGAVKIAAKTGVSAVLKTGIAGIAEALGTSVGGPIGTIITALIVKLGEWALKQLSKLAQWMKKHKDWFAGFAIGAIAIGALFGSPVLIAVGLGAFAGLAMFAGPQSAAGAAVGVTALGVIMLLFAIKVVVSGFVNIMIGLLVTIFTVLFIYYIITVSGYVVPYWNDITGGTGPGGVGSGGVSAENPYIGVGKVASPSKLAGPGSVTITVTITAKRGNLTNVKISDYICKIVKKGSTGDCSSTKSSVPPIDPTLVIEVGKPYTFSYTVNYGASMYKDSLAVDTITITADASTKAGVSSSSTASVCIGNCPQDCPSIWPVSKGTITQGRQTQDSHRGLEAIDIGSVGNGSTVYATHGGIVEYFNSSCEGDQGIMIKSTCNGVEFRSRYSHMQARLVPQGRVEVGTPIGVTDNRGTCTTGAHLHYEFRGLKMEQPWIPKPILPRSDCCGTAAACYSGTVPCAVSIP